MGELFLRSDVVIKSESRLGYGYDRVGNSILVQRDKEQECILDINEGGQFTLD